MACHAQAKLACAEYVAMNINDQFVPIHGMIAIQFKRRVWCFKKKHIVDLSRRLMPDLNALDSVNLISGIDEHIVINKQRYFELIKDFYPRIIAAMSNKAEFSLPCYEFDKRDAERFVGAFLDGYYYSFHTISWGDGVDINGRRTIHIAVHRKPSLVQKLITKRQGNIMYEINFHGADIRSLVGYSFDFNLHMENGRLFHFKDGGDVREKVDAK